MVVVFVFFVVVVFVWFVFFVVFVVVVVVRLLRFVGRLLRFVGRLLRFVGRLLRKVCLLVGEVLFVVLVVSFVAFDGKRARRVACRVPDPEGELHLEVLCRSERERLHDFVLRELACRRAVLGLGQGSGSGSGSGSALGSGEELTAFIFVDDAEGGDVPRRAIEADGVVGRVCPLL